MRTRCVCRIPMESEVLDFTFPYVKLGEMLPSSYVCPVSVKRDVICASTDNTH